MIIFNKIITNMAILIICMPIVNLAAQIPSTIHGTPDGSSSENPGTSDISPLALRLINAPILPKEIVVIRDPHEPAGIAEPPPVKFLWPSKDAFQESAKNDWKEISLPDADLQKWISSVMGKSEPTGSDRTQYVESRFVRYLQIRSGDHKWLIRIVNSPDKRPIPDPVELDILHVANYSNIQLEGILNDLGKQHIVGNISLKDILLVQGMFQLLPLDDKFRLLEWRLRQYMYDRKWQTVEMSFDPPEGSNVQFQLEVCIGPFGTITRVMELGLERMFVVPMNSSSIPMTRP